MKGRSLLPPSQMIDVRLALGPREDLAVVDARRRRRSPSPPVARTPPAPRSSGSRRRCRRCSRSAGRAIPRGRGRASDAGAAQPAGPASSRMRPTSRLVWLLPAPVRTAHTATTGFSLSSIVERGPSSVKSAPAASGDRRPLHHLLVGDVRVGEDDLVHPARSAISARQLLLGEDRDPVAGSAAPPARRDRCGPRSRGSASR